MKTKSIFLLLALFAFSAAHKADAQTTAGGTVCIQVMPCDEFGELLPGYSYENPCFASARGYCESLKKKTLCRSELEPLYQENSNLFSKMQDMQAKITKLKRTMKQLNKRKAR